MRQGKPRLRPSILKRLLPLVVLATGTSPLAPRGASPWWEVRFALTVRGDYGVKAGETAFAGEYAYRARWAGTMEEDGPDFLLYHTRTDIENWEIVEKATPDRGPLVTQADVPVKPGLRLNYILRKGADLLFDFEVQGFKIPLGGSGEKFDLVFPCSRESADEGVLYDASVIKGKNVIALGGDGLDKPTLEKSFSWEWKRQRWTLREAGPVHLAGFHKATVVVTLVRHL